MAQIATSSQFAANALLKTSLRGQAAIASYEGVVLRAYPDPGTGGKPWTIGIGHTSAAGAPAVTPGMVITRPRAFEILAADLIVFEKAVIAAIKVQLSQNEFDALVSFCLNVGPDNFVHSSVVRLINAGNLSAGANAMVLWNKADGHVLAGLVTRRASERQIFLVGFYPVAAGVPSNDNAPQIANGVLLTRNCIFPDAVRALQTDLVALGFAIDVDGDFGRETEAAVKSFQTQHNLTIDGMAGPATRSTIAAALKSTGQAPAVALHPLPGAAITSMAA